MHIYIYPHVSVWFVEVVVSGSPSKRRNLAGKEEDEMEEEVTERLLRQDGGRTLSGLTQCLPLPIKGCGLWGTKPWERRQLWAFGMMKWIEWSLWEELKGVWTSKSLQTRWGQAEEGITASLWSLTPTPTPTHTAESCMPPSQLIPQSLLWSTKFWNDNATWFDSGNTVLITATVIQRYWMIY